MPFPSSEDELLEDRMDPLSIPSTTTVWVIPLSPYEWSSCKYLNIQCWASPKETTDAQTLITDAQKLKSAVHL